MDFTISPEIEDYRARIARFVEDELIPLEADRANYDPHENIRTEVLETMRAKARAEGLWCLQLQKETGGQGLGKMGLSAACRTQQQHVRLRQFDVITTPNLRRLLMLDAAVVVVHRHCQNALRMVLADHVLVEERCDLTWRREMLK